MYEEEIVQRVAYQKLETCLAYRPT